jgi:tRNA pseudouridine(38-40) synthase
MTAPISMDSKGIHELTRNKGENSIEHNLFKAFAAQFPSGTQVTMTHISRASSTHEGEHATKQVISLNLSSAVELPSATAMNKSLPDSIRVFKVMKVGSDFSARRTCEARTVEYLIPTYAFSHPPEVTEYCNQEEDVYSVMPMDGPKGGMFKTMKRGQSLARRATFMRKGNEADYNDTADEKEQPQVQQPPKLKKKFSLWNAFSSMFKSNTASGSERLKESLNATMTRGKKQSAADDENFSTTLGRTINRNRNLEDVLAQDINERQMNDSTEMLFEPLSIPAPDAEELQNIRQFRLPESVYKRIVHSLALFNGTHNFHNFIPGSVQDDNRCFVRVFNIEAAPLEIHHGMEWVRIKVQARSFGRDQIKRMMGIS